MVQCQGLSLFLLHFPFLREVALVPHKDLGYVWRRMLGNRLYPIVDAGESFSVQDIVGDDDSVSLLVEGVCQRLKSLLSGCVPNFHRVLSAVLSFVFFHDEVEAQGGEVLLGEFLFSEHVYYRGFSHSSIAQNNNLNLFFIHFFYVFLLFIINIKIS